MAAPTETAVSDRILIAAEEALQEALQHGEPGEIREAMRVVNAAYKKLKLSPIYTETQIKNARIEL
jgi:hypothetical protein